MPVQLPGHQGQQQQQQLNNRQPAGQHADSAMHAQPLRPFSLSVSTQRYVKCPLELQALQLEIVISEETERETQRQALKVRAGQGSGALSATAVFCPDRPES